MTLFFYFLNAVKIRIFSAGNARWKRCVSDSTKKEENGAAAILSVTLHHAKVVIGWWWPPLTPTAQPTCYTAHHSRYPTRCVAVNSFSVGASVRPQVPPVGLDWFFQISRARSGRGRCAQVSGWIINWRHPQHETSEGNYDNKTRRKRENKSRNFFCSGVNGGQ